MSEYLRIFCGDRLLASYWFKRAEHVSEQLELGLEIPAGQSSIVYDTISS